MTPEEGPLVRRHVRAAGIPQSRPRSLRSRAAEARFAGFLCSLGPRRWLMGGVIRARHREPSPSRPRIHLSPGHEPVLDPNHEEIHSLDRDGRPAPPFRRRASGRIRPGALRRARRGAVPLDLVRESDGRKRRRGPGQPGAQRIALEDRPRRRDGDAGGDRGTGGHPAHLVHGLRRPGHPPGHGAAHPLGEPGRALGRGAAAGFLRDPLCPAGRL